MALFTYLHLYPPYLITMYTHQMAALGSRIYINLDGGSITL